MAWTVLEVERRDFGGENKKNGKDISVCMYFDSGSLGGTVTLYTRSLCYCNHVVILKKVFKPCNLVFKHHNHMDISWPSGQYR